MAKQTLFTEADKAAYWLARADEYDREAAKYITAGRKDHWLKKASEAREKAQQHLSPAPSEAESPA